MKIRTGYILAGVGVVALLAISLIPFLKERAANRADLACIKEVVAEYIAEYKSSCQELFGRPNCELPFEKNNSLKEYYTSKQNECNQKYLGTDNYVPITLEELNRATRK